MMILSGDPPRSRVLSALLLIIMLALLATPFIFPGAKAMNVAAKICIFAALVGSYDLLLGYTGSVSFAHTMFYGIGSYAIAIALYALGPNWGAVAAGVAAGLPLALLLALAIGLFSLRVEAIFFAMITLAVASAFLVLASQLSWLTGGEDGRSFQLPELLRPGTVFIPKDWFGIPINGRVLTYYIVFAVSALMILALLRVVNSPFGRVLQAIRENRFRAEALGYRTVFHLTYANCIAAVIAALAGMLNALWLRYAGPDTSLSFSIMLDILLMVVIGGMGTIYGAIKRFAGASKGGGSLGRPRYVATALWRGGRIAREAKALLSSGWDWAAGSPDRPSRFDDAVNLATAAPDPFLRTDRGFIVRRIAADTRKVERDTNFDRKLDAKLLRAMGSEIGSLHASTSHLKHTILKDLEGKDATWLQATAKAAAASVEADFAEWKAFNA